MNRFEQKIATFLTMAYQLASLATCPRRQVGCILLDNELRIIGSGYNGAPSGEAHCTNSSEAACNCVHAEVNALINCPTVSAIAYVVTTTLPCKNCFTELSCQVKEAGGALKQIYGAEAAGSSVVHQLCQIIAPAVPTFRKWPARKVGGNYQADGIVIGQHTTTSGATRLVFEFNMPKGLLHIFTPRQVLGDRTKQLVPCFGTYRQLSHQEAAENCCHDCSLQESCSVASYNTKARADSHE